MHVKSKKTTLALANAIEVATGVIHEVAGDQVAKTLNGQRVTRAGIAHMVAAGLHSHLAKHTAKPTGSHK